MKSASASDKPAKDIRGPKRDKFNQRPQEGSVSQISDILRNGLSKPGDEARKDSSLIQKPSESAKPNLSRILGLLGNVSSKKNSE